MRAHAFAFRLDLSGAAALHGAMIRHHREIAGQAAYRPVPLLEAARGRVETERASSCARDRHLYVTSLAIEALKVVAGHGSAGASIAFKYPGPLPVRGRCCRGR